MGCYHLLPACVYGLYLLAVAGWVRTHCDLLGADWFRRARWLRWAAAVAPPAAAGFGLEVAGASCRGDVPAWAAALGAALACAGVALGLARPFRPPVADVAPWRQ